MAEKRVHAFTDDALGEHDAVGIAGLIRDGTVSAREAADAAAARVDEIASVLDPLAYAAYRHGRDQEPSNPRGMLGGVPTFVKDNTDVAGMPSGHGTEAFHPYSAGTDSAVTSQLRHTGFSILGKSRLPEFGFNASTEFAAAEPTRNPWHTDYSPGASSGGAAAMVAAGAVPIAHANDGGGSIRIPAACCGLVGLKPSRGRLVDGAQARTLPINLISEGVVSRSVRDTAAFLAATESYRRNPALPALGEVRHPPERALRIGLITDSVSGTPTDTATRTVVEDAVEVLGTLGHRVEPVALPVGTGFVRDFTRYWGMLSFLASTFGKRTFAKDFDARKLDGLSSGLRSLYRRTIPATPATLYRLSRVKREYAATFDTFDLVLTPTLGHTTPLLGHLSPNVPFEQLLERLTRYVAFTPLNNVSGGPAITVPFGHSADDLPVGIQFSAAHGDERTLLEIAYALEEHRPWRRIQD